MISVHLTVVLVLCVSCVISNTTPPQGCMYNGKHYHVGESWQPDACQHCRCAISRQQQPQPQCIIGDCFFVPCVDSVHDPTKCCRQCPNGHNCKHADGTIINKGDVYKPDPYTTCECPQNTFGLVGTRALCVAHARTTLPPIAN